MVIKDLNKKLTSELCDIADKYGIEQCDYCKYEDDCPKGVVPDGSGEPLYPACADGEPDNWVDTDILIERLEEENINEET